MHWTCFFILSLLLCVATCFGGSKCCDHHSDFKCPNSEAEVLKLIWTAANGRTWRHKAGWQDLKNRNPMKWKMVCAPAGSYPDGDYYAAYSPYFGVTCKHGHVVELDLSDNGLRGCISPAIGCLKHVKVIDLSSNYLTGCVPHTIGWLDDSLMELYLDENRLNRLPSDVCDFAPQCKKLTISHNPWRHLPQCINRMAKQCRYGADIGPVSPPPDHPW